MKDLAKKQKRFEQMQEELHAQRILEEEQQRIFDAAKQEHQKAMRKILFQNLARTALSAATTTENHTQESLQRLGMALYNQVKNSGL